MSAHVPLLSLLCVCDDSFGSLDGFDVIWDVTTDDEECRRMSKKEKEEGIRGKRSESV